MQRTLRVFSERSFCGSFRPLIRREDGVVWSIMEYYTELRIGLFNAWIGSLIMALTMIGVKKNKTLSKRLLDVSWHTPADKKVVMSSLISVYGMMLLTLWVPLKIGSPWFYAGVGLYCIAYVCHAIALHNYAKTPENEMITKGMYQLSRNPLYLFYAIMFLGLVIASMSLPLFVVWIICNIFNHFSILGEERYCLERYPETYKKYMQRVPRYILFF